MAPFAPAQAFLQRQICCCSVAVALLTPGGEFGELPGHRQRRSGYQLWRQRRSHGRLILVHDTCFAGSSSATRTGWTAGRGAEWRLDQHWSAKIEYQFVDLGSQAVRITALTAIPPAGPSSFNAGFHDQFHVARIGLNYW